ncbi:MAG: amidohydrolase family protein, partial [Planctomycetota bacterium]
TTTLIDHHASPSFIDGSLSVLQEGIEEVGCRGVLCYETTDRNGAAGADEGLLENARFIEACRRQPQTRFAALVGGHASFTMEDETLTECVALCRDQQVGLHLHVAEDPVDDRLTMSNYGMHLIERLESFGILELTGSILAHGIHLTHAEVKGITSEDSVVCLAHNPSSNMNNGVGYASVARFGKPPLLGTDGIGADLWREARTACFKSHDAGEPIPLDRTLQMLAASARVASSALGARLGVLAKDALADLVVTSYVPPTPLDAQNLAAHLVFGMGPEYVRHVMIDGDWRLREGQVVGCDEHAIRTSAQQIARDLFGRI